MATRRESAAVQAANPFRPLESGAKIVARTESAPQLHAGPGAPSPDQAVLPPLPGQTWAGSGAAAEGGRNGPGGGGGGGPTAPLPPGALQSSNMTPLGSMKIPYVAGLT